MENIPLGDLSSLSKEVHVKTREASQNTDLDMRGGSPSKDRGGPEKMVR